MAWSGHAQRKIPLGWCSLQRCCRGVFRSVDWRRFDDKGIKRLPRYFKTLDMDRGETSVGVNSSRFRRGNAGKHDGRTFRGVRERVQPVWYMVHDDTSNATTIRRFYSESPCPFFRRGRRSGGESPCRRDNLYARSPMVPKNAALPERSFGKGPGSFDFHGRLISAPCCSMFFPSRTPVRRIRFPGWSRLVRRVTAESAFPGGIDPSEFRRPSGSGRRFVFVKSGRPPVRGSLLLRSQSAKTG